MSKSYKSNKSIYAIILVLAIISLLLVENTSRVDKETAKNSIQSQTKSDIEYSADSILGDPESRIHPDFAIPKGLESRVKFWFEIYSKYESKQRLIHHLDYPWVQFKILDHTELLAQPARFAWTNPEKADQITRDELKRVRMGLEKLYKKVKSDRISNLTTEEKFWLDEIQKIPGPLIKNLKFASTRVRVQTGQKDHFVKGLSIAERYLPHMEKVFEDHGLPTEIARLPLVESSFNKMATSKVGSGRSVAVYEWNRKKVLVINSFIDERRSPLKSTEAAAELIKENYQIMGRSWPLAITAYNHGPVGLKKAVKKLKTKDIVKIIKYFESNRFSFASENFYSEFLAALYVEKYHLELFPNIEKLPLLRFETFKMTQRLKPSRILQEDILSKADFLDLNPDLKNAVKWNIPIPKGFVIYIPPEVVTHLERLNDQKVARNKDFN